MRTAKLILAVALLGSLAACDGLDFAEGGEGGGVRVSGDPGIGGSSGDGNTVGSSVGSGDFAPAAADVNSSGQSSAALCSADWPTITETPNAVAGYASAQYARHLLLGSPARLPEPELLRADDFLAYYGDRTPLTSGVEVDVHFVEANNLEGYVEIRVRRTGPTSGSHYVIMADVSPSMAHALPLAETVLHEIGSSLQSPGDVVSLVTFAGGAETEMVQGTGQDLITSELTVRGGNDLEGALKAALVLTQDGPIPTELILVTDGGVEINQGIYTALADARIAGVRSSVVQVAKSTRDAGQTVLHDSFLNGFAIAGGGASLFIGDDEEAALAFGQRFDETFRLAFEDMSVSVELPGGFASLEPGDVGSSTGASSGVSLGFDRWHSKRHRVSVCGETKAAAQNSPVGQQLSVTAQIFEAGVAVGDSISIPYNAAFISPSQGALLDDLILATVQYLRAPDAAVAPKTALLQALQAAGCPNPDDAACATLDELLELVVAAESL